MEYCHTKKKVTDFMLFDFRYRIMGMSNSENIAEVQKVRDDIAQNKDLQNGQTSIALY